MSPYDTPVSSMLRFIVEIVAWTAGPWAAAVVADSPWAALPAAVVLLGLPAVLSTPGDKTNVIVATPGPARLAIELGLAAVAIAGSWVVWPSRLATIITVVVIVALVAGARRAWWLLRGAPLAP